MSAVLDVAVVGGGQAGLAIAWVLDGDRLVHRRGDTAAPIPHAA